MFISFIWFIKVYYITKLCIYKIILLIFLRLFSSASDLKPYPNVFLFLKNDKFYKKSVLTICAYYVKILLIKA